MSWSSLVLGVADTLRSVEATIDKVVGIPPGTKLPENETQNDELGDQVEQQKVQEKRQQEPIESGESSAIVVKEPELLLQAAASRSEAKQLQEIKEQEQEKLIDAILEEEEEEEKVQDDNNHDGVQIEEIEQVKEEKWTHFFDDDENDDVEKKAVAATAVVVVGDESENLIQEFSKRLGDLERRLGNVKVDRDRWRQSANELERLAAERLAACERADAGVAQLTKEGKQMMARQSKHEAVIKRLRVVEREQSERVGELGARAENAEAELATLRVQVAELRESSASSGESLASVRQLADESARRADESAQASARADEKARHLQAELDKAWQTLAAEKQARAAAEQRLDAAQGDGEREATRRLEAAMRSRQHELDSAGTEMRSELDQLRRQMGRDAERAAWREDELREELAQLQTRLQAAESRNAELSTSVADATQPFVRQIAALQQAASSSKQAADKIEASLVTELHDVRERAAAAAEQLRGAQSDFGEARARVRLLDSQLAAERARSAQLLVDLDELRARLPEVEARCADLARRLDDAERARADDAHTIESLRGDLDASRRHRALLAEQFATAGNLKPTPSRSKPEAKPEAKRAPESEPPAAVQAPRSASSMALSHTHAQRSAGELSHVRAQLESAQRTRSQLEHMLAKASRRSEALAARIRKLQVARRQHKALMIRHDTALELLGQKDERLQELESDIVELKQLYRTTIDQLCSPRQS
jgi:TATA element modulatory factor